MRIVFLGSGEFARKSLEALVAADLPPTLVVTQPLRRRGRGGALVPTPAQESAERAGIPVVAPERVNDPDSLARLRAESPDLLAVAEYGQLLSEELLRIPRLGSLNVHASLLPRHRGATPVAAAILAGDRETGVTIQRVVKRLDAGPMLARRAVAIGPEEDAGSLTRRLAATGAELLVEVARAFRDGRPPAEEPQDESLATVCRRLRAGDAEIDFAEPAERIARLVRALHPAPGARTALLRTPPLRLRILRARALAGRGEPGAVADREKALLVGTGEGLLEILSLHPENSRAMEAGDFRNGYRVAPGDRFGPPPALELPAPPREAGG